jgi:hypothetical protein
MVRRLTTSALVAFALFGCAVIYAIASSHLVLFG